MNGLARDTHNHMTDEEFEELILGTLPAGRESELEAHLASCDACRESFGSPRELLAALPFGAPDPGETFRAEAVWEGIAEQLHQERASTPAREATGSPVPVPVPTSAPDNVVPFQRRDRGWGWTALAAVAVISLLLGGVIGQVLPRFGDDDESETFTVEFTEDPGNAAATLSYLPDEEIFVFSVSGLPPPPEGYVYQAWLINADGPIPTGTMSEGQQEMAAHGDKSQYTTFAITLEKGPLGSPKPTSEPIIRADLATQ